MFITPDFTVSQDEEGPWAPGRGFVILRVRAPHVRAQQVELAVDGRQVKFHARPFFLSLTLPGEVVEDERASASYDVDEGRFTVVLPKADPAEHFPALDLLTKLLAPSRRAPPAGPGPGTAPTPLVQVLGSGGSTLDVNPTGTASYGFNDQYSGVLAHFREAGNEVMELDDPEHSTPASRRSERTRAEDRKFSGDYYMCEPLDHLSYVCPWVEDEERSSDVDACAGQVADLSVTAGENVPPEVAAGKVAPAPKSWALNETEREEMRKLANKECEHARRDVVSMRAVGDDDHFYLFSF
ncbi:MAG: hypothetical protein BJ554DRAFT_4161 [Olpidium bornovanus]|uniref:CS domain-containing protein n=1 Tax=Olpidium bornovanus TaxID=278681 RepID=A0A8H8DFF1_9FUNG|nr:MAG: hypothetical protein BJ554DRAFT_4161 [Olpidium bornovanus]